MNEETLIQYAGDPVESIPTGLREQLLADPQLKKAFEDQLQIKSLIALKRFEEPDPRLSERVRRSVRVSISEHTPLRQRLSLQNAHLLPSWVRMTAVVVIMLGLSVLTHQEMLRNQSAEQVELAGGLQQGLNEGINELGMNVGTRPAPQTLQVSELVHRDAFTTQLPERFLFPLPDLAMEESSNEPFGSTPFPEPTVTPSFIENPMTLPVIHVSRP
jgi:hypothetical protein